MSFLDEIHLEAQEAGLIEAVARGRTEPIFDWLMSAFSLQGISDRVALNYMERHGFAQWSSVQKSLNRRATCPKLLSYWAYDYCRYHKGCSTCSEPEHFDRCPVPRLHLRNGRLNQTAYRSEERRVGKECVP